MSVRLKRLKLNGVATLGRCSDCGIPFTHFLWSPFWCPKCDQKRIDRITKSLREIEAKLRAKEAGNE